MYGLFKCRFVRVLISHQYIPLHRLGCQQNMKEFKFRGLMAPVFTPFKDSPLYELDLEILPQYADHLIKNNITGILVNGTTGEGVSLTVEERLKVLEAWMKVAKSRGMTVMAQIGGTPLKSVHNLCSHAESLGVDALLCLPELYFKPRTESELADYLHQVSNAAPSTPLFYYHIPSFTQLNLDMELLMAKCHSRVNTFAGIKYTHTDLEQGARCVHYREKAYTVFLGADQVTAGAWILGFDSAISTTLNMFPDLSCSIIQAIKEGHNDKALYLQLKLNRYIKAITSLGSWVGSMKSAMEVVTGLKMGPPRPPLNPIPVQSVKNLSLL